MARPLVVIGTPCFGGLVAHEYMMSILRLTAYAPGAGFDVAVITLGHDALITRARSTIVGRFLDNPATTHLLFVDADISFEPEQVARMLRFDKDIVAGLYPAKVIDWQRVPERFGKTNETLEEAGLVYVGEVCKGEALKMADGFATAQYAGTGFQLIKRQALERMAAAYPETKYKAIHVFPRPPQESANLYALFDCVIDPETGAYLSEDYAFCRRWRAIGGEIWLDLQSRLTHAGSHDYKGNVAARFAPSSGQVRVA
ncbi:MAG TPA: hypothetical protein VKY65_07155 [Alphaproteobacteria bacterium]|nr:hypothetical protein [Alphaproteobacteria bacterium]